MVTLTVKCIYRRLNVYCSMAELAGIDHTTILRLCLTYRPLPVKHNKSSLDSPVHRYNYSNFFKIYKIDREGTAMEQDVRAYSQN